MNHVPRWKPGFRFDPVPSNFHGWLPHLTEVEKDCYLVVVRHTFGFRKERDAIASAQFEKETEFGRTAISAALNHLEDLGLLEVRRAGRCKVKVYQAMPIPYLSVRQGEHKNDSSVHENGGLVFAGVNTSTDKQRE